MARKIFVTGNAGSGKTTLAHGIGYRFQLPVFGLDRLIWDAEGQRFPRADIDAHIATLVAEPEWVIDGVSDIAERAADIVVFLDVAALTCSGRVLRRDIGLLFHADPEEPEARPNLLGLPGRIAGIWGFGALVRPDILERVHKPLPGQTYLPVSNEDDARGLMKRLDNLIK